MWLLSFGLVIFPNNGRGIVGQSAFREPGGFLGDSVAKLRVGDGKSGVDYCDVHFSFSVSLKKILSTSTPTIDSSNKLHFFLKHFINS